MSKPTPTNINEFTEKSMTSKTSLVPTSTFSSPETKDEFADPQYLDPKARLPRIQALRGMSPDLCGYFLSVEEMAKSGWVDFDPVADQLVTYTFESSGQQEQGILLKAPRMLVCPRTPLLAKGSNQASFSAEWQKLTEEITACHAIASGIVARPKNALFKSLCVFAFTVARELVGKKQKSPACRVVAHESVTMENWRDYFVGYDANLKTQAWEGLQPTLPMIVPGETTEVPALRASVEE
jgi:hypothetical protein